MRSHALHRFRGARRGVPLESFSRTEKIIAFCRVLLASSTLVLVVADPKQPSYDPDLGHLVLAAYVAWSLLLFLLVRGEYVRQDRVGHYTTAADIAWITLITVFTEGGASPFFLLQVFVISSVSARWGFAATVPVTALIAVLYPAVVLVAGRFLDPEIFAFRRSHLFRPIYLLILGYLIGFLGEHERRAKRKLGLMLDLSAGFQGRRPLGRALTRHMRRALAHFQAQQGILVLRDPDSGKYFTWTVAHRTVRTTIGLRITDQDPLALPFAAATEGFLANDLGPGTGTALCYDVLSGQMQRRPLVPDVPLTSAKAQALLAAPVLIRRELRGHALVVRESRRKFTRDDLEFLLLLVGQGATGFEAARLQQKAEEVAVLEERARIARDLHDGFIQALAGIDLRVEACKLLLQRDPSRIPRELEDLHQAVDHGYREVRRYLAELRSPSRQAELWSTLDHLAAEFTSRERLQVHVVRPPVDPGLPAHAAYDVSQIVREALRNAVRHGGATQAIVRLSSFPTHLSLIVRDNGRGFEGRGDAIDSDGFLARIAQPWSIRERAESLGATLRVWSRARRGAEVSVMIPLATSAGHVPERRRYA